ncbi:MAG: laccase domain-containing protein, partial [Rhodoferax sp.]|nr:laccase domain-containing protein [Rhodoferax sp.]
MNPDWLVPQWPAPVNVHAVCTTRAGGMSAARYDSLNLGDHVGDRPLDVAANRAILQQAINARPVFLSQVHGTHVESVSG